MGEQPACPQGSVPGPPDPSLHAACSSVRWAHAGRAAPQRSLTYPRFLHLFRDFRFIFLERQEEEKQAVTVAGSPGGTSQPRQHAPGQGRLAAEGAVAAASAAPRGAPCSPSRTLGREEENPNSLGLCRWWIRPFS